MKVLVSGSTGLVGSALVALLAKGGHGVLRLVRTRSSRPDEIEWDPIGGRLDAPALEGIDAVVHLAGENIASGRWTAERKRRIRDSRVRGTALLSEALSKLSRPPKVLASASAIGYYGDRGDEVLREESGAGSSFLAGVCRDWEEAARPALDRAIRVAHLRFGVILSPKGGALQRMLLPFRLGAGGKLGSGKQYMSWISLDDAVGAIQHVVSRESLSGPVNVVAPTAVTNLEFTRTLGKVLSRPTVFPMPAFAARLVFGEMADELLLASARVEPGKLLAGRHAFQHPRLEGALRHLLGR
jgi:hypothetical protein